MLIPIALVSVSLTVSFAYAFFSPFCLSIVSVGSLGFLTCLARVLDMSKQHARWKRLLLPVYI